MEYVKKLGRYFVAGVLILLPLVITVAVAIWMTGIVTQYLGPGTMLGGVVKSFGLRVSSHKTVALIVGWTAVLSAIFLFGLIAEMGARKYVQLTVERIMQKIPIIGKIYNTATQLVDIIGKKGEDELKGMSIVYCSFGGQKRALFLALMPSSERFIINEIEYSVVLIPTAPLPVGGGLIFVPSDSIRPADMSVEDFMSIYLSMGASCSQYIPIRT